MPLNRTPPRTRSQTLKTRLEISPSPETEQLAKEAVTTMPHGGMSESERAARLPPEPEEDDVFTLSELSKNHREVHSFVRDVEPLALDGSNLAAWKKWTETAVFDMTGVQRYWTVSAPNLDSRLDMAIDKCASRVLYCTVHTNLKNLIGEISLAHDRMNKICSHFRRGGRTAQFAIFKSLIHRQFDPTCMDLMVHINQIINDVDRLESEGFSWTRDNFIGMLYQLGAPATGEFGMDGVNNNLDAQFWVTGIPCTSEDVQSAMQLMITSKKTAQETEGLGHVLAASFRDRLSLKPFGGSRGGSRVSFLQNPHSLSSQNPRSSTKFMSTPTRGLPPAPITSRSEREASDVNPIPIPKEARLEVHQRIPQCFHCGEFGHWVPECPDKARNRNRKGLHWNDWRKFSNNYTYSIDVLFPSRFVGKDADRPTGNVSAKEVSISAAAVEYSREEAAEAEYAACYLLDSGATHTISNERDRFVDFRVLSSPIILNTATKNSTALITGVGRFELKTREGGVEFLDDVYFCKAATGTLISQGDLLEKGAKFTFCGDDVIVHLRSGQTLSAVFRDRRWWIDQEYKDEMERFEVCNVEMSRDEKLVRLWHERFGHIDMKRVRKLCVNQMGFNLPKSLPSTKFVCEDCLVCKSVRRRTLDRSGRELGLLEVLVSDVMGPFKENLNGARFVVTFRDVCTTYSEVVIIKQKSEVPDIFTMVVSRWERETGVKVKCVRTDGGGEYMKLTFNKWLEKEGILHEYSNPYEPEQNGVAERLNRTLGDMARTMLKASGLPQDFWSLAYSTACYLHNRLPNTVTGDKTPFELFYNRKPQFDLIRTFGAVAFLHRHKEQRQGKLAERGRKVRMVGYIKGGKGWLFYDPLSKELVRSAVADFPYEDKFLFSQTPKEENSATSSSSLNKILNKPVKKGALDFVLNALRLGDFRAEEILAEQDREVYLLERGVDLVDVLESPRSYAEAMKSPFAREWSDAMDVELRTMEDMKVWRLIDLPDGVEPLGARWVYSIKKMNEEGVPVKFKARLVAQGFKQQEGLDYTETFAPTATFASLRMILAIAAKGNFPVHSFDITAAYLHSDLDEKVYLKLPPAYMKGQKREGKVLEVVKALYGTKQGGRCWWKHFENVLSGLGFSCSQYDQSVYSLRRGGDFVLIWVHVDDGAVMGTSVEVLDEVAEGLVEKLKIRWSRSLDHIVGIDVRRGGDGSFKLTQPGLTKKILIKYLEKDGNVKTPLDPKENLVTATDEEKEIDKTKYLSVIGMLNYLSVATRPDITYATNLLARFSSKATDVHWGYVQRVLRYLRGTEGFGLELKADDGCFLETYVDVNWGGEFAWSVHGFVSYFLGCPVAWTSKRQSCVATSTCHAEYMGLGTAARELVWLRNLATDMIGTLGPGVLWCDNTSAIHVAKDNSSNKRTRHADREFFYVNEQIFKGTITINWVDAKSQKADVLTKALGPMLFERGRRELGVC